MYERGAVRSDQIRVLSPKVVIVLYAPRKYVSARCSSNLTENPNYVIGIDLSTCENPLQKSQVVRKTFLIIGL